MLNIGRLAFLLHFGCALGYFCGVNVKSITFLANCLINLEQRIVYHITATMLGILVKFVILGYDALERCGSNSFNYLGLCNDCILCGNLIIIEIRIKGVDVLA